MSWPRRLRNLLRSTDHARDIEREMSFHVAERADDLRGAGMRDDDALREARRRFGNRTSLAERTRDAGIITWLDSVAADVRYALRAIGRSPVFALVAVASLGIGIGANTAIYSLIDAVLLRPLPVANPDELVHLRRTEKDTEGVITNPIWEALRNRQSGFQSLAAFGEQGDLDLASSGESRYVRGSWVSGDFFTVFGARPAVGRLIGRADDVRGCPGTAVLGHSFWASEYGRRPDIVGTTISLNGKPLTILGVASAEFRFPEVGRDPQVYLPICAEAVLRAENSYLDHRSAWWLQVIGRRAPGVTLEEAQRRIARLAPEIYRATVPEKWSPENQKEYLEGKFFLAAAPNGLSFLRSQYGETLPVLMGAVGLLLLIACANVANLLLARAAARTHEVAIRRAIGAGRGRLVRQLLTESALLALVGAVVGLVIARWATPALVALISTPRNPVILDLGVNARMLLFTALASAVTTLIFGLAPAWRGTRVSPQMAMKAHGRGVAEGHARFTLGKALVAGQVALSLLLLVGAGLLISTLRNLSTLDPGFRAEGVLVTSVDLGRTGIPQDRLREAQRAVLESVRALPGVRSASTSALTPVGRMRWNHIVEVDGFSASSLEDAVAWFNEVSDGYFSTMDTRFLAGRDFDHSDAPGAAKTAIVNDAMARKYFGATSPLGRQLRIAEGDGSKVAYTVVGVVQSAKYDELREESSATVYLPASQSTDPGRRVTLEIRGGADPLALVPTIKSALVAMHPAATLEFTTLSGQLASSLRRERLLAVLSGVFGGVALLLSTLGLYGVMAYSVARRRNEIGVRIALGADGARVLRMVLADVVRVVAIGLVVGVAGALVSGKLVRSLLYGLEPADPRVMAFAAATLTLVALGAGLVPAWRAARLDPTTALREE